MRTTPLKLGPFEVYSVQTGSLRLDGGAMFGVVPKVLWSKTTEVDDLNRIPLATRSLVAVDRDHPRVVLVDTGCGTKWAPKEAARFDITYDRHAITSALHQLGLSEEAVTDVIITHLHFDHNGGLTDWLDQPGGRLVLRYPKARHWIHREHWEHAIHPHSKDKASFLPEDFEALSGAGVLEFVEGERPAGPFQGLEWFVSHGHTRFHLHPVFGVDRRRLIFVGDLVPTVAHLRSAWVMAYDLQPMNTIEEKHAIYRMAIENQWTLAFAHDPRHMAVTIDGAVERPIVVESIPL